MGLITVNSISRKYEMLYKRFLENSSADESFFAVNNAMIFAYFLRYIDIPYTKETQRECYERIIEKYGADIFFNNVKKNDKYKKNRDIAIEIFTTLFEGDTEENYSLEQVLGNVLERHINQKDTGAYYTPNDTTRYMSWNAILIAIIDLCENKLRNKIKQKLKINSTMSLLNSNIQPEEMWHDIISALSENEKAELIEVIYNLNIIDPTCGSGAFIIAAFECLETLISKINMLKIDYNRLLDTLYGVDCSKEAIQLTKLRILMRIAGKTCNLSEFDCMFRKHFIVADALKGSDFIIDESGFDWKSFGCKFNCIIGNPPYVESKAYVSDNFKTKKCGNLYAYTIERACNIIKENGVISFVVPLSLIATQRMQKAKGYLENKSDEVYYSTFADRPGCIFTGVHQRLTIFFAHAGDSEERKIYSSSYMYWYNNERAELFDRVKYYSNNNTGILPKLGNEIETMIYKKLSNGKNTLMDMVVADSDNKVFLSTRIGFWTKAFLSNVFSSREYKEYQIDNEMNKYIFTAILNSSTFYFLWVVISDCWHITNQNLQALHFNLDKLDDKKKLVIKQYVNELMHDLEKNKKYIGSKQTEYEYKHKFSKSIINKIDDELACIFGLNDEEIGYIKAYTEKYRVNSMEA